jgi:hypothetical protein
LQLMQLVTGWIHRFTNESTYVKTRCAIKISFFLTQRTRDKEFSQSNRFFFSAKSLRSYFLSDKWDRTGSF